jgi:ligand-binding sensor domain-containing protein
MFKLKNIQTKNIFNWILYLAIIILLLLSGVQNIFPQQNKYEFDKFKTSDENFPKVITSVVKDKLGFVWFATEIGLYRFDGYNFKTYFHNSNDSKSIVLYL